MVRLRPRQREANVFTGFSHKEIEKLEKMFIDYGEQSIDHAFCVKVAKSFSHSAARAGKPIVKPDKVKNWFHDRQKMPYVGEIPLSSDQKENKLPLDVFKDVSVHAETVDRNKGNRTIQVPEGAKVHDISELEFEAKPSVDGAWYDVDRFLTHRFASSGETVKDWFYDRQNMPSVKETPLSSNQKQITLPFDVFKGVAVHANAVIRSNVNQTIQVHEGNKVQNISELEFEAKSSIDGAWYDVERFLTHRFTNSGETEVHIRYVGFGAEEDEWVNLKRVRERSIPLENWDCRMVKVGNILLCLQESEDQTRYFDARILDVQRKMHDIRGCRCIFSIQYEHDKSEENVRLERLCRRP